MGLSLATIGGIAVVGLLTRLFLPRSWHRPWILGLSVVALFAWQPFSPLQWAGFLLPTLTIVLVIGGWWLSKGERVPGRGDWMALIGMVSIVTLLGLSRFLPLDLPINRPPSLVVQIGLLLVWLGLALALTRPTSGRRPLIIGAIIIIALFVILKSEPIAQQISALWRTASGRDPSLASAFDLTWIGYSYIAFRLLHTLRDRATGQLPDLSLQAYAAYVLFFPALIAGPIDRAERFLTDWDSITAPNEWQAEEQRYLSALLKIARGLFFKFVIADSLAFGAALTPALAEQVNHTGWAWVLLYGYGARLFFDFAGYTDIVIGLGLLFGVTLPENFNQPYRKSDIASFWQSWHMTLSNWVRFYVFSPLSRSLLRRKPRPHPALIVFVSQLSTMLIIGLWHGITWNFAIWGAWHGLGLFAHKRFNDQTRKWQRNTIKKAWQKRTWRFASWFLTFQFVMLGWVWFAIPSFGVAMSYFKILLGL